MWVVVDRLLRFITRIEERHLHNPQFNICNWYACRVDRYYNKVEEDPEDEQNEIIGLRSEETMVSEVPEKLDTLEVYGQQIEKGTYPAIQQNHAHWQNIGRHIPKPLVIVVKLDGHPVQALLDSGLLGDFVSSTTVKQLGLCKIELTDPVPVQLAVQGSRSRINYGATALCEYQGISYQKYFDVMNLQGYDVILGTPWIYQHSVTFGLNPSREGLGVARLATHAVNIYDDTLKLVRQELRDYAEPLCQAAGDTPLPPL
ncbi:hypothetical protein C0995_013811 [Termitomyces sp. Mi166|nr:hypothetical protein C0995_013811 [Termitomyces sp. Mi166\